MAVVNFVDVDCEIKSEQLKVEFKNIFDITTDGLLLIQKLDSKTPLVKSNLNARRIFGLNEDGPFDFRDLPSELKSRLLVWDDKKTPEKDVIEIKSNDRVRKIDLNYYPINRECGVFRLHDETEFLDRIVRLSESEATLKAVFNAGMDAVLLIESDGNVLDVNERAREIFGIENHKILAGINIKEVMFNSDEKRGYQILKNTESFNLSLQQSLIVQTGLQKREIEIYTRRLKYDQRQIVLLIARDVTEQRKSAEKLKQTLRNLELFNRHMMGREERVLELKKQYVELEKELGREPSFKFEVS